MDENITAQWAKDNLFNSDAKILECVINEIKKESRYSNSVKFLGEMKENVVYILVNRGFKVVTKYKETRPYTVVSW